MTREKKNKLRDVLITVLIGACTAFLTSLFEDLLSILKGSGNDVAGGVVASATWAAKHLRG